MERERKKDINICVKILMKIWISGKKTYYVWRQVADDIWYYASYCPFISNLYRPDLFGSLLERDP
jgi:hypothetical protein